jgi:SH3-like domain-containing protein
VQPTPAYPTSAAIYALLTPGVTPQFVDAPAADEAAAPAAGGERAAIALYMQEQTPSAMGIAPGGASIYAERGGRVAASVPPAGVLTVTGKSADGAWYAVYNDDAVFGWTPAGQLRVYGGDDLVVVEEAPDPGPIATLLARAAEPVDVLDDLLAQFDATATAMAQQPTSAPVVAAATVIPMSPSLPATATPEPATPDAGAPAAAETPQPGAVTGVVSSDGRLNLRAEPDTAAAIVRKLDPGDTVTILEANAGNTWLRVQLDDGFTGWVAAEFISE